MKKMEYKIPQASAIKKVLIERPREGWAEDARRIAEHDDDALVWPEIVNAGDVELVW